MRLDPDAVVLVLGRAPPAQPGQDLVGVGQPLGEHDPHRVPRLDPQLLHRGQPAACQGGGDLAEVAADVVAALEHRPGGLAARVDLGERVQDGGRADAEPQVPGHQAQQVAGLQRGGPGQQPGQQLQLRALRARPLGERRSRAACARPRRPPGRPPGRRPRARGRASSRSAAWPRSPASRTSAATSRGVGAGHGRPARGRRASRPGRGPPRRTPARSAPGTGSTRSAAARPGCRASSAASRSVSASRLLSRSRSR